MDLITQPEQEIMYVCTAIILMCSRLLMDFQRGKGQYAKKSLWKNENTEVKEGDNNMERFELDNGEALVAVTMNGINEGIIVSVKDNKDDTLSLHIKIGSDGGNVIKNIFIPLKALRPFKGFI